MIKLELLDVMIIPIMVSFCTAFNGFLLGNFVSILLDSGINQRIESNMD